MNKTTHHTTVLISGASGLVGSALLYLLLKKGYRVKALIRKGSDLELMQKLYPIDISQIIWCEGDITDIYSIQDALEDVSQVYHTAAMVSFDKSRAHELMKINVEGTENMVNACLAAGVQKFCYISSVAAIGRGAANEKEITEESDWQVSKNNTQYAISKFAGEREVWRGIAEGLDAVIVNPSIIIGPAAWNQSSAQLFNTVNKGLKYYTEGVNGFVFVEDVAELCVKLMESEIKNERFILSADNLSYKELFNLIAKAIHKNPPSISVSPFLSEVAWRIEAVKCFFTGKKPFITKETARTASHKYFYSSSKIKKFLGFQFTPIEKAIAQTGLKMLSI